MIVREEEEIRALSTDELLRELASYTVMMGLPFSRPRLLSQEATRRADASPAPETRDDTRDGGVS